MGKVYVTEDGYGVNGTIDYNWDFTGTEIQFGSYTTSTEKQTLRTALRFVVPISKGITITSATLKMRIASKTGGGTLRLKIRAEDQDDAAFPTDETNLWAKTLTTAGIDWDTDMATAPAVGELWESPDISSVVQEVIDRAGWENNNHLQLIIVEDTGNISTIIGAASVENTSYVEAILEIKPMGGSNPAPISPYFML